MNSINTLSILSQKLENPKDYFSGTPKLAEGLPVNILLFHRNRHPAKGGAKHHRFLLIINCGGKGEVILDGKRFILEKENGLLVMPFQHHHYAQYDEKISWLKVTFEISDAEFLEVKRQQVFRLNQEAINLAIQLVKSYDNVQFKNTYYARRISCYLSMLLNEIVYNCNSHAQEISSTNLPMALVGNDEFIDQVTYFIYKNLKSIKNVTEISSQFHCSESHLRALFKKKTKISIWSYIQELRIHKAQEYLGSSQLNLSEIASECGYSSVYVFSNAFKKILKISPLNYRKKLKTPT